MQSVLRPERARIYGFDSTRLHAGVPCSQVASAFDSCSYKSSETDLVK